MNIKSTTKVLRSASHLCLVALIGKLEESQPGVVVVVRRKGSIDLGMATTYPLAVCDARIAESAQSYTRANA